MTFIKLDKDNFVNTKIINKFKINYKKSDSSTFLYDENIDSKSIIYNQSFTHGTFENSLLGLQENNEINENIASFFNFANSKIDYLNDSEDSIRNKKNIYFEKKRTLSELYDVQNDNLKQFNFKNSFDINRTENKFLPSSFEMSKFESVKNNLYEFYKNDFTKDFYPEIDYGFCNYNTINFFSQKYNENKVHSNCIVYSNQKNNQNVNDVDLRNNFSINLWINARKNNKSSSGCIIHIPDIFSLYSIEETTGFKLCLTTGEKSKKNLNTQNFPDVDFTNTVKQTGNNICISSSYNFEFNNWYNITVNFIKIKQEIYSINFYKNGDLFESFNIEITREIAEIFNSYICLGNKPYYYKDNLNIYNTNYEDIFYTFFGKNYLSGDVSEFDGPFYIKDLDLGTNKNYIDEKFIDDIILNDNTIYFKDDADNNSSFHGEINEIKIYSESLSLEKIQSLYLKSLKDLEDEIQNNKLSFYVPVYYLPIYVKKIGMFNCKINNINLYYNAIYNPFFANSSLGRDISVENYLVEFVKSKKPNIIISGFEPKNIYENYYESLHYNFIDNINDFAKIKQGIGSESIFLENLDSMSLETNTKYNNISYRNLLILPNDNGIPEVNFDPVKYFLENDKNYQKDKEFFMTDDQEKLYHIDCKNTLKYVKYQSNDRLDNIRESQSGNNILLNIDDQNLLIYSTKDSFYDISNYLYHDNSLDSIDKFNQLSGLDEYVLRKIDNFNKAHIESKSNPINKDYLDDTLLFRNNNSILEEDIQYRYIPLPYYSINKNDLSLFSSIIDISTQYYNKKIKKGSLIIKDNNMLGTNGINIKLSDNKKGLIYRDDCLTKSADWNYVGHIFYKEGICTIHNTSLYAFGKKDFEIEFISEGVMFVSETNIPIRQGMLNVSNNPTYNKDLRLDESAFNSDEPFVYITDVNIHDENLNIVAKAKMAHPIPKKNTDNLLIRLKMDF